MNRVSMLITLLLLFSFRVNATSAFYENRTEQPIRVRLIVNATAPAYAGDQYHLPPESDFGTVVIPPFKKAKVATFNRYYGLENGGMYDYYFLVYQLDENGNWFAKQDAPLAQIRLFGHGAGSTLSYGYKDRELKTDYNPYVIELYGLEGHHQEYGVKSIYTSGFDDVEFVLAEHTIADTEAREHALRIATYNLWMIPSVSLDISERATILDHTLSGYDVLTLQEAFSSDRDALFDALSGEYFYRTDVVGGDSMALYDGGVVTLSRYPILETDSIVFEHCSGTDCYADKGIVYTKIDKLGQIYHIFNTHLASFSTPAAKRLRRLQLGLLRTFMLTKEIPQDEAVIFAGDFNIDKNNDFLEYLLMLATLEVDPPLYTGYRDATFDPRINPYAQSQYSGGDTIEYLDYILVSSEHKRARQNINQVKLNQRVTAATWGEWHLSDHFGVEGHFVFDPADSNE
ncbi:sphingomyelin phosphodiesterase [Vibrio caribbeanicus]|uniref:Endonuclease/exonuclease/phosphatase domain-containing protein n=1 Tax=Vibrio caribbeanicus ATCC BAA-2122 TaxID=796620 RepID=E3BNN8_9VIBR|nr:sphingomyelin phosphodiesterase [Vibrio caribbeanicus]EFP95457.1 hypothetical protein VIBC2010_15519 [Vibrio caribbeanicus ATCC BAA-2122]